MLHRKTSPPGTGAHPPAAFVGPPSPRSRGGPPTVRGPRAPQALRGRRIVPVLCGGEGARPPGTGSMRSFVFLSVLPSARWLVGKWAQSLCINTLWSALSSLRTWYYPTDSCSLRGSIYVLLVLTSSPRFLFIFFGLRFFIFVLLSSQLASSSFISGSISSRFLEI